MPDLQSDKSLPDGVINNLLTISIASSPETLIIAIPELSSAVAIAAMVGFFIYTKRGGLIPLIKSLL